MLVAADPAELLSSMRELKGEKLTLARSHEGLTLYDSLLNFLHLNSSLIPSLSRSSSFLSISHPYSLELTFRYPHLPHPPPTYSPPG